MLINYLNSFASSAPLREDFSYVFLGIPLNFKLPKRLLKIYAESVIAFSMETIVREQDETEYLLSSPANREHLEKAIENVKQGKVITFENLEQAIQRAEELAATK